MSKDMIILFDLDGTLIDSTEAILESFHVAYDTFNENTPCDEDIKAQIGHPLDQMFTTLGINGKVARYVDAYKMHYRKISRAKTTLLPMAREAIALAKKHAILGIVTTKTAIYSVELLEHMGIMDSFSVLIGREDVTNPKPDPEPIEKAINQLPKVTSNIWMVGDTCMDMDSATSAGIQKMAVLCGYGTEESLSRCSGNIATNSYEAVEYIIAL